MLIVVICTIGFGWAFASTLRSPLTKIERLDFVRRGVKRPLWHRILWG
jgi:hypothetical protein